MVDTALTLGVRWTIASSPSTPVIARSLRRVAFGDIPGAPVVVDPGAAPELRWLAAVVLGGRGRYGAAWSLLEPIVRSRAAPGAVRAHAAITRASHLRQLGGHGPARYWDGLGLALAGAALDDGAGWRDVEADDGRRVPGADVDDGRRVPGTDAAAARVDALLGLAADALGLGEFALAERLLERAEPLAARHPSWRPRVRSHWIRAELALSLRDPGVALDRAQRALELSVEAGAVRHEIKSQLVWVVARSCMGEHPERLYRSLEELAERTIGNRLGSLEWPIRLLLGQMAGPWDAGHTPGNRARFGELQASIRQACDPIGRMVLDRSPWVAAAFGP